MRFVAGMMEVQVVVSKLSAEDEYANNDFNYCSECGLVKAQHTWLEQEYCWGVTKLSRRDLIQTKITDFLYNEGILHDNR